MHNIIALHKRIMRALWCLAKIAERAGEGIAVLDLNGTIRFVNAAWATMHGYNTRHELVGKKISVCHTEEQMKSDVIPFIDEVKYRGQLMGPVEHIRRDGAPFLTKTKMILVRDESGKGIGLISFITDITESKQVEKRLRQQAAESIAANEKLQQQISQHEQAEVKWQQQHSRLEQRVAEQAAELTAANEKLQHEIAARNQKEDELQQYRNQLEELNAGLTAANEKLQRKITENMRVEKRLRQQVAESTATNEKLRRQISQHERLDEEQSEDILKAEESGMKVKLPFDPQELKALSELARRLM